VEIILVAYLQLGAEGLKDCLGLGFRSSSDCNQDMNKYGQVTLDANALMEVQCPALKRRNYFLQA
jgi:hypothetical protein